MLKEEINKESLRELKEILTKEQNKLRLIPNKISVFNFFGSMIKIFARQEALKTIDNIFKLIGIEKSPKTKDIRDSYE